MPFSSAKKAVIFNRADYDLELIKGLPHEINSCRGLIDAFNRHDPEDFSLVFAEDGDFTDVAGNDRSPKPTHRDL
jgi:hypothetical protein